MRQLKKSEEKAENLKKYVKRGYAFRDDYRYTVTPDAQRRQNENYAKLALLLYSHK